jgi:hypothetical protein
LMQKRHGRGCKPHPAQNLTSINNGSEKQSLFKLIPRSINKRGIACCPVWGNAVQHPFHAPDASCSVYFAAERLGNGLVALAILPIISPTISSYFPPIILRFYGQNRTYFLARAPPLNSTLKHYLCPSGGLGYAMIV